MISAIFKNQEVTFETNQKVFSPNQLDTGSRLLLEKIQAENPQAILDLGCGYGAIGIIFGKSHPQCHVTMIDNDPIAVMLAEKNATVNEIRDFKVFKIDVTKQTLNRKFDLVVSNPPWTKNRSVVPKLIEFAFNHLNVGGKLYIVINKTFRTEDLLESIFQNVELIATEGSYKILRGTRSHSYPNQLRETVLNQLNDLKTTPDALKDQNFLISESYIDKIVKGASVKKSETVLEIGPGLGQITKILAEKAKKVVAVEIDQKLRPVLNKLPPNVNVIYENAWTFVGRHMSNVNFDKFVSNIPYSICQPILHKLAHAKAVPIYIILPEQFVNLIQNHHIFSAVFDIEVLFKIPRGNFYPIPKTDSYLVFLHKNHSKEDFPRWVRRFMYENEGKPLKETLRLAGISDRVNLNNKVLQSTQYGRETYDLVIKELSHQTVPSPAQEEQNNLAQKN